MSRELLNAINVTLDGYSILISLIIAVSIFSIKKVEKSAKWFALTNIASVVYSVTDIIMWVSEGTDAAWKLVLLPLSSFLFYFSGIFIFLFYIRYIIEYYNSIEKVRKGWWYFCIALCVLFNVFTCFSAFFNVYYTITPENTYQRGKLFNISVIIEVILYIEALLLVIKHHKKMSNAENIGFASFIFCPFITQIVQIANYGIALNSLGLTISFFIIYINMNQRLKTRLDTTENQLTMLDNKKTTLLGDTIINLANLIEYNETGSNHTKRITKIVRLIAKTCRKNGLYDNIIDKDFVEIISKTSALHDIGNISVPHPIIKKPAKVTPEEYETIKTHAEIGSNMINDILAVGFEREFIKMACDIAKYHHERWDGNGYPEHLKGKEIPLSARIVALADVFDALVTPICYKNTVSFEEAFHIIDNESGKRFDPELVMEFLKIKNKVIEIIDTYSDSSVED